jgi:hypothetical protein
MVSGGASRFAVEAARLLSADPSDLFDIPMQGQLWSWHATLPAGVKEFRARLTSPYVDNGAQHSLEALFSASGRVGRNPKVEACGEGSSHASRIELAQFFGGVVLCGDEDGREGRVCQRGYAQC